MGIQLAPNGSCKVYAHNTELCHSFLPKRLTDQNIPHQFLVIQALIININEGDPRLLGGSWRLWRLPQLGPRTCFRGRRQDRNGMKNGSRRHWSRKADSIHYSWSGRCYCAAPLLERDNDYYAGSNVLVYIYCHPQKSKNLTASKWKPKANVQ